MFTVWTDLFCLYSGMFVLLKTCLSVGSNSTSVRMRGAFKVKLIDIQFIVYEYPCVITYLGQVDGIQSLVV